MSVTLEITMRRGYRAAYEVEMRLSHSDDAGETLRIGTLAPDFDPAKLGRPGAGAEYGLALGRALLASSELQRGFDEASGAAGNDPLRIRLYVHPDAAVLYGLAWETTRDPRLPDDPGALLFAGDRRVFSRFVTSTDLRPLYRRPLGRLRVLVAVASPVDINSYAPRGVALADIEEEVEVDRVRDALAAEADVTVIRSSEGQVTLDAIAERLREDFDIFYLCCHGTLDEGSAVLFLDGDDGTTAPTPGEDFVRRIAALRERPRLVVLGSCQSAGGEVGEPGATVYGANGAFVPLGPHLTESGITAVIAMQGNVSLETINDFIPTLLRHIANDGLVDRAFGIAQTEAAARRRDWWVPSLLTRLRSGEIFRRTGFAGPHNFDFEPHWNEILASIGNRRCTPILGPALLERHVGLRRELAARLARSFDRPLPRGDRDVLSLLAQQLSITVSPQILRQRILTLTAEMVGERYRGLIPSNLLAPLRADVAPEDLLDRLRQVLDFAVTREGPNEPNRLLARLQLPLYLTANADDILARFLETERGAHPEVEVHRWHAEHRMIPSVWQRDPNYVPSVQRPLVFHFFGSATHQESITVTQDEYVDALIVASRPEVKSVPEIVRSSLTSTTLLFLGFQLDDWSFRSIFRFIINQEGASLLRNRAHAAVQVDPEESGFEDPEAACRFVQQYLGAHLGADRVRIYWGTVGDFMAELEKRRGPPAAVAPVGAYARPADHTAPRALKWQL